tara:strand:+ start:6604 stop:8298 length:1695 start_codon:yes stop_codon:yes gene_type:complete
MADFYISPGTRAKYRPSSDAMNISMDFNASPNGGARGTEVIIPNNASPSVRAAAEKYNQLVAGFANKYGITGYPVRGVRTRAENKRGVANTIHAEPFFNDDEAMQRAVQENPAEFAELYRSAFGGLDNARLIAPHGVGKDRGASSAFFGDETSYGELMANSLLGQVPQPTTGTQGAASMMQQEQKPRGLLGSLGMQKMEEGAEGETGQRFYNRDSFKDTAAILAQGFGRMGIMGMEEIADSVAKQRTEAKAQNKTIEMLGKMGTPQANSAIEYIKAGGAATDALKIAFAKPEKVTPYTDAAKLKADFDRGLISLDTYEAEMTKPPKTTAKEEQIARLKSTGVPEHIAIGIVDGRLVVSRDPVTGAATIVDKAELLTQQAVPPATEEPVQPEGDGAGVFEGTNPKGALGLSGFGANVLNTVVDAFGAGQPADKIAKASSVLSALSTRTSLGLASEFPGRPSNLTRDKIEKLTIKPGELGMGPSKALDKAEDMVRAIKESLESANRVVGGRFSPTDKAAAQTSISMLTPLLADYQSLLKGLAPQSPTSPNGTTLRPDVAKRLENYE